MSARSLRVVLKREKKVLATVEMTKGCEPILVGRAKDCALRIPADDYSASGAHARIFWKGSSLYIEDAGSRNGIYFEGSLLKGAHVMKVGTLFAIGGCLVQAEAIEKSGRKRNLAYHRLEFLNGEHAGRMVEVKPREDGREFDIGLDPQSSIPLNDLLVSRRHVVLHVHEDGECWIEDLSSRNGTFVNGEKLVGKERLLRDGDKISVAFFDFRFLDRNVAHTRVQFWLKLATVSITVCVMGALYILWTASRAPADRYLEVARHEAAAERFDEARDAAMEARNARDASDSGTQIDSMLRQIELWRKTCKGWNDVRTAIAEQQLKSARDMLNDLLGLPIEAWGWNARAAEHARQDAVFAAQALQHYFDGRDAIAAAAVESQTDADRRVRATVGPIKSFLRQHENVTKKSPYLTKVMAMMTELQKELERICSGYDEVDAAIARITMDNTNFRGLYEAFEHVAADEHLPKAVRSYARQQLVVCQAFVTAQEGLDAEFKCLKELDFKGLLKRAASVKFPSPEVCLRHSRYSDVRAKFMERHTMYLAEAQALDVMVAGLREDGIVISSNGPNIDMFLNQTNILEALSFDCLQRRPPNARRPEPVGTYDRLFGIEHVYEALCALPRMASGRNLRTVGFTPCCVKARQAFDRAETFVQYLNNDDKKYLRQGDIGRYYERCSNISLAREKMVRWMRDLKGSERKQIVARYFSDYFSPNPLDVVKREIAKQFGDLRQKLMKLGEAYQFEADPVKQLAIRDEILAKGIPGDPVMHAKWAQKFD